MCCLIQILFVFNRGLDLQTWRELRKEKGEVADLGKFIQHLHSNNFIPNIVIVDCTADSEIAKNYYQWLRKGIHIVTPNKKANSGPLDQVSSLGCILSTYLDTMLFMIFSSNLKARMN